MILYRIEHPVTKKGPYQGTPESSYVIGDGGRSINSWHTDDKKRPTPSDDNMKKFEPGLHKSAFDSKEKLKIWFEGWFEILDREGFEMLIIEVPDDKIIFSPSGKQCAFEMGSDFIKETHKLVA